MKLEIKDNREKIAKARKFITDFKTQPTRSLDPFFEIEDITKFGLFDFPYVNRKIVTFNIIEDKFKNNKYNDISEIVRDFRGIF